MVKNKWFFKYCILGILLYSFYIPLANASIFSKQVEIYNANRSKTKARVDLFTDQVTHVKDDGKWVKLSRKVQKGYQNRYKVQKKIKRRPRKKVKKKQRKKR